MKVAIWKLVDRGEGGGNVKMMMMMEDGGSVGSAIGGVSCHLKSTLLAAC